jgi:MFS transporter, SP family, general alpha glucoside:H+ symporter
MATDTTPKHDSEAGPKGASLPTATHDEALIVEAKHASDSELQMTLWQAIKLYPKAIAWSLVLSSTLVMEGYDLALLGNLYASPPFNQKYGTYNEATQKWAVSAAWQSGLSNGARAGEIIGLIIAGWTADRYGLKMTTIGSLVLMIAFIFVLFFAPNVQVLVVGEVLCGKYMSRLQGRTHAHPVPRHPVGSFPECHSGVCCRGGSASTKTLPNHGHQCRMGYWPVLRRGRQQGLSGST